TGVQTCALPISYGLSVSLVGFLGSPTVHHLDADAVIARRADLVALAISLNRERRIAGRAMIRAALQQIDVRFGRQLIRTRNDSPCAVEGTLREGQSWD